MDKAEMLHSNKIVHFFSIPEDSSSNLETQICLLTITDRLQIAPNNYKRELWIFYSKDCYITIFVWDNDHCYTPMFSKFHFFLFETTTNHTKLLSLFLLYASLLIKIKYVSSQYFFFRTVIPSFV